MLRQSIPLVVAQERLPSCVQLRLQVDLLVARCLQSNIESRAFITSADELVQDSLPGGTGILHPAPRVPLLNLVRTHLDVITAVGEKLSASSADKAPPLKRKDSSGSRKGTPSNRW
jgi:hypothetical protein